MAAQPLILLANGDRWFAESLKSVLGQGGYRVVTAAKRHHVLEQARQHRPDGIILDLGLSGRDSFSLCRALRADPDISRATPIILTTAGPALRAQQLDALRAGAWELRGAPLDIPELLLRLGAYTQGKLDVDRFGAEGLLDPASGLYSTVGVARRSEELAACTARLGMALACVVFRSADGLTSGVGDRLALTFKSAGRISDAIGRTGPAEFTVFAPATDAAGADQLVSRITETVARALPVKLRAGVSTATAATPQQAQVPPTALLERARAALH